MNSTRRAEESVFRDAEKWYAEAKSRVTCEEFMNFCYLLISPLEMEGRKLMPAITNVRAREKRWIIVRRTKNDIDTSGAEKLRSTMVEREHGWVPGSDD